jgi:stringent starvation protein B
MIGILVFEAAPIKFRFVGSSVEKWLSFNFDVTPCVICWFQTQGFTIEEINQIKTNLHPRATVKAIRKEIFHHSNGDERFVGNLISSHVVLSFSRVHLVLGRDRGKSLRFFREASLDSRSCTDRGQQDSGGGNWTNSVSPSGKDSDVEGNGMCSIARTVMVLHTDTF